MWGVIQAEILKLRKSPIWLLIFVSPILSVVLGMAESFNEDLDPWLGTLALMAFLHAMLFLPLLTGVFAAFVCRYEHVGGGWKQMLALPVSRSSVYLVKLAMVMLLLAVVQVLIVGGLLLLGTIKGYTAPIPWYEISWAVIGGWVACLPLAALQMAVSTAWASFAAPLAVNVIFTLPNMLIVNSAEYGPYYPWAQPLLAMVPFGDQGFGAFNVGPTTLFIVILGSFAIFLVSGLIHFTRKAI
ncbi:ABC transporter permease [Paenibacillus eucommiae]|uniref:ABC transporter permease n=1 Tax=Paenibacillus eucommiae TaxID=1355755 RepID=A0ABS4IV34_9BACL|nr:ABC transporter permease [Paenibacillus eucommiae]MBP1991448.1 hypothetical protein [Paenibacillus eucommiae]